MSQEKSKVEMVEEIMKALEPWLKEVTSDFPDQGLVAQSRHETAKRLVAIAEKLDV